MKLKNAFAVVLFSACMFVYLSCSKSSGYGNGGSNQQPPNGTTNNGSVTVNINNMAFPGTTTVKKGTVVKWVNQDAMAHTVTSDDGNTFNSGNLDVNATFSYTANTAGSFAYHCNYHSGMHGTLIVTE